MVVVVVGYRNLPRIAKTAGRSRFPFRRQQFHSHDDFSKYGRAIHCSAGDVVVVCVSAWPSKSWLGSHAFLLDTEWTASGAIFSPDAILERCSFLQHQSRSHDDFSKYGRAIHCSAVDVDFLFVSEWLSQNCLGSQDFLVHMGWNASGAIFGSKCLTVLRKSLARCPDFENWQDWMMDTIEIIWTIDAFVSAGSKIKHSGSICYRL